MVILFFQSCDKRPTSQPTPPSLTLYSSVDDPLLRQIVADFEKHHAIKVNIVGDTEATKTTGLVQRLLTEKNNPRADVWWSNELLGTQLLADQNLFEPITPPADLPTTFQDPLHRYHAFALRARVIAYSPKRVFGGSSHSAPDTPRRLTDLTDPKWNNRVGMARPQFGTTRAHMTNLLVNFGEPALRTWLRAMKANHIRLYDGNSSVVRAIAQSEIDIGLTDTDDVFSAQRENWPVALVYEATGPIITGIEGLQSNGPLLIPNTIALIKNAPHPDTARTFLTFALSEQTERLLADSDSHNTPLRPTLRAALGPAFDPYAIPLPTSDFSPPQLDHLADLVTRAMKICDEELGP